MHHLKLDTIKDYERNVVLVFDEIKTKSGLVFCKITAKLVGFTEMGKINDEMETFSRLCNEKTDDDSKDRSK